ncbi:MAG: hypothetical protein ACXVCY_17195 [Pseudobdellovibrionaceae bacterium]
MQRVRNKLYQATFVLYIKSIFNLMLAEAKAQDVEKINLGSALTSHEKDFKNCLGKINQEQLQWLMDAVTIDRRKSSLDISV